MSADQSQPSKYFFEKRKDQCCAMAIRYIARSEGWKPSMCKTEVIPPYEWAMFVPTETGECKRFYFDGTNEFEVPYTWRDFPISNLLYWPQRIV